MGGLAVNDHGLEVLKKSAVPLTPGNVNEYLLRVSEFAATDLKKVLSATDLKKKYIFADPGTKQERVTRIDYTAVSVPGVTIRRDFTYISAGTAYVLDFEQWSQL